MATKILVLFAHPAIHRSIVNRRLIRIYRDFHNVTFRDLYDIYPEFMIDTDVEQSLLIEHSIIIFHHPLYWYSAPPILKQWQDLVLKNGFAYGEGGNKLAGKKLLSVISTGQPEQAFSHSGDHRYPLNQLLLPFEQIATFCQMKYLPPFVTFGPLRHTNQQNIFAYARSLRKVIRTLSDEDCDFEQFNHLQRINPDDFGADT